MIQRLERLKNTVNKYMADIRPDQLTTCQSERKSVVSRRPSVLLSYSGISPILSEVHRGIPQFLQANSGIVHRLFHDTASLQISSTCISSFIRHPIIRRCIIQSRSEQTATREPDLALESFLTGPWNYCENLLIMWIFI
jgi:hypothetical protein